MVMVIFAFLELYFVHVIKKLSLVAKIYTLRFSSTKELFSDEVVFTCYEKWNLWW